MKGERSTMTKSYEFICDDQHPDWLKFRNNHITASEMSVLFDRCPWKSKKDLLVEKVTGSSNYKDSKNMWWGRRMEKINMQIFSEITGIRTRSANSFLRSTREPLLAATLDGFAKVPESLNSEEFKHIAFKRPWWEKVHAGLSFASGLGLIEMKQTESYWEKNWWPNPPDHYLIQVQQQLFVTGLDWALLVAKVGASDMVAHFIEPDEDMHKEMIEDATLFWKEVKNDRIKWDECGGSRD